MIEYRRPRVVDQSGLTLLEVILAVAILAIGILASLAMQSTALQSTRGMTVAQTYAKVAFTELDFQRSIFTTTNTPTAGSCEDRLSPADAAANFECNVVVIDCLVSAGAVTCPSTSGLPNAYLVEVTVSRPNDGALTLRRVLGERIYFDED